ncbi:MULTISPECIES: LCP family protein [Streptococcus]|uniref:Regulatory protein MsrR n=1 Tax=Streptococcus vestibularis ATCC 49124 TaxID=889206 RepID=A0ABP2KJ75_STRVE|nr:MULTISPECIES: LCP family protein [Streptococcus]EFX95783.1 cell envelope-like function transcriptional attenuator common domain protein [Streptococcus vestibularis ATCC 49124]
MTKSNDEPFTHHERLRYNYLLKNLAHLNGQQASEFNYLQGKLDAYEAERSYERYQGQTADYQEARSQPYNNRSNYYQAPDYEDVNPLTEEGLPVYREEAPQRNVKRKKVQRQAAPSATSAPRFKSQVVKKKRPKKKRRLKKVVKLVLSCLSLGVVFLVLAMAYQFYKGTDLSAAGNNGKAYQPALVETFNGKDTKDGVNILILGSDQRVSQESTEARTDSIIVVNVGNKEGKIKMVSFMRDTLVNIKGASETDYSQDLKLNTAFNIGEQNNHQGAELMRQTLKRNFDIDIKYYAMVDFETFAAGVDTLFPDGVKINTKFSTVDGKKVSSVKVPDDLRMDKDGNVPNQTIKVGKQQMDGRTLLNYARFRKDDEGDYGRTKRQQQVMQAIMKQVKNPISLFKGSEALGKVYSLTSTNMSMTEMLDLGLSNAGSFKNGISSQTIPSDGDWIDSYDLYGGQGIEIDFDSYQDKLKELGFR